MALERDPPYLGDIGDETETWEEREHRREEKLEREFETARTRRKPAASPSSNQSGGPG